MHYIDLTSAPKTNLLKEISEFCSNGDDKAFLLSMSQATLEGKVGGIIYCTFMYISLDEEICKSDRRQE